MKLKEKFQDVEHVKDVLWYDSVADLSIPVSMIPAKFKDGFQLRYIYFIDPEYRKRLKVPEIPFSRIDELNAGMYKGESITQAERHAASHYEP